MLALSLIQIRFQISASHTKVLGYSDTVRPYQRHDTQPVVPSDFEVGKSSSYASHDHSDSRHYDQNGDGSYDLWASVVVEPWHRLCADAPSYGKGFWDFP